MGIRRLPSSVAFQVTLLCTLLGTGPLPARFAFATGTPDTLEVLVSRSLLGRSQPLTEESSASVLEEATKVANAILNRHRDHFVLASAWDHGSGPLAFASENGGLHISFPRLNPPGLVIWRTGRLEAAFGPAAKRNQIASVVVDSSLESRLVASRMPGDPLTEQIVISPDQARAYADSGWTVEHVVARYLKLTIVVHPVALGLRIPRQPHPEAVRQTTLAILIAAHQVERVLRRWSDVHAAPLGDDAVRNAVTLLLSWEND